MINLLQKKGDGNRIPVAKIKHWIKEVFALDENANVLVTEISCTEPGCPTVGTRIAVWEGEGKRKDYKIHAAMAKVKFADIEALKGRKNE
jgi:nitrate reductase delta subunit